MQIAAGAGRRVGGPSVSSLAGGRKALIFASILGLLAAYLSWSYVRGAGEGARAANLVPVVVAAQDIPVRTQVTAQMLELKQVPADARHAKALTSLDQLNGKVTNLPIAAGEQVLSTKFFARKEDSGLAFRVPPGRRAVSVNVNEVISTGGLIVPGDFVDVIAIFTAEGANGQQGGQAVSDSAGIILQNIEVLAVAQSIQGPAAETPNNGLASVTGGSKPADARQEAVARPNARTTTLAVTPEEAQKLILAEEKGKIRLALRGVDDKDTAAVGATRLSQVRGG
jgi:pilus assembly protein CpaB